jgi:hypothetical protein
LKPLTTAKNWRRLAQNWRANLLPSSARPCRPPRFRCPGESVTGLAMIGPTFGDVVVRNVGPGAAIDADLTLTFEGSEAAEREERQWLAHVIAPGDDHEFLPGNGIGGMDDLVAKHPTIALEGEIRDAFGQTHFVDERINVAEFWGRLENANERWVENADRKVVRELEKICRELEAMRRHLGRGGDQGRRAA